MEFIILGLLLLKPMSGYEIGGFIKNNLTLICSNSAGSIRSALKKLVESQSVSFIESVENGKNKKVYSITKTGENHFYKWIQNPMRVDKIKNMELSKLFFLGFADKRKQFESINNYIEQLRSTKSVLLLIQKEVINAKNKGVDYIGKNNISEIIKFQEYTLKYGIDSCEFEIKWYLKLLKDMEE